MKFFFCFLVLLASNFSLYSLTSLSPSQQELFESYLSDFDSSFEILRPPHEREEAWLSNNTALRGALSSNLASIMKNESFSKETKIKILRQGVLEHNTPLMLAAALDLRDIYFEMRKFLVDEEVFYEEEHMDHGWYVEEILEGTQIEDYNETLRFAFSSTEEEDRVLLGFLCSLGLKKFDQLVFESGTPYSKSLEFVFHMIQTYQTENKLLQKLALSTKSIQFSYALEFLKNLLRLKYFPNYTQRVLLGVDFVLDELFEGQPDLIEKYFSQSYSREVSFMIITQLASAGRLDRTNSRGRP